MCGIVGIINFDNQKVNRKTLHRMDETIAHRGPDGHGEFIQDNIGLANRRLAIIDPTPVGNQPMSTADGNLWITFNGEIFNYKNLRNDLLSKGYNFRSQTDTETILYGYKHYGATFVKKLIGQFAFCIWDKKNHRFFLARDQLGVNPLFYAWSGKTFIFASEIKTLLASGLIKRELNPEALHHYLSIFTIPTPLTMIKGIKSLPPGYSMLIDKNGIKLNKFWEVPIVTSGRQNESFTDLSEKLKGHLIAAVSSATVSDVPVAAFLSGGIDSSVVVALMAKQSNRPIKTFSMWAEGGEAFDERKYAKLVAQKYHTDHHEVTVGEKDILKELPKIVYYFDQPTGGSLETYFISKFASEEVKVALSGIGGDELFAGYHELVHKTKPIASIYRLIPRPIRSILLKTLINLSPHSEKTLLKADQFLSLPSSVSRRLYLYYAYQEDEKKNLYHKNYLGLLGNYNTDDYFLNLLNKVKNVSDVDKLSYLDLKTYTQDDLLMGMNMMSMANSLEARVPLLDPRLIEFAASIPPGYKSHRGISKYILKEVAKDWLPAEVINHKKTGFGLPRAVFMTRGLKRHILHALSPDAVKKRGIFNELYIQQELDRFYIERSDKRLWSEHLRIWLLFILEIWCRLYIDNAPVHAPVASLKDILNA